MAFSLLYIPCIAVLGVIKQETGTFKWPVLMTAITLVTAYVVTFLIYNIGTLMGFG
jgi:ferrous iron transport protein B